ncbi:MAG TPA: FAD-binding oxidoreductase [Chlamydiales bacterium]|nr:FAD-binding oxidoreductase [Chlamydiales bacterium]
MTLSDDQEYERKKRDLVLEFQNTLDLKKNISLSKKTSNLFRNRKDHQSNKLNVKHLNSVLSIDPLRLVATVEGMVTFEDFVNETLQYDCLPAVVPQLKTITVGGAIAGLGIESSSFRYGLVHETVLEMEILTGSGQVVVARPDNEHSDLFFAFPNSYGTLGYCLKAMLQLIRAKKFVRLTNIRFDDPKSYFAHLESLCMEHRQSTRDTFIDGVIFNDKEMYIILGEFVDSASNISNYTYLQSYYRSIQKKKEQFLTVYDYIWRWDADWFWCSKHFGMDHFILRLLFGKFMLHSSVYWKIKHLFGTNPLFRKTLEIFESPKESVIQDILMPICNASLFYDFLRQEIQITPIWICPFQFYHSDTRFTFCPKLDLYLDFGFWDMIPTTHPKGFFNRLVERKTEELGGLKSLYSDSYYTKEEFWNMYSKPTFDQLKRKYDPNLVFKDLYAKVSDAMV